MTRRDVMIAASAAAGIVPARAEDRPETMPVTVRETLGQRRFGYPVTFEVPLPQGKVSAVTQVTLTDAAGKPIPAQIDFVSSWGNGSVQRVAVSVNLSPGPLERLELRVQYGPFVSHTSPTGRLLEETETAYQALAYRIPKSGDALIDSVRYGTREFLKDPVRLSVRTANGPLPIQPATQQSRVLRRGPFNLAVELSGVYRAGDRELPYTTQMEALNTKSWFRVTHTVEDPASEVTEIALHAAYVMERAPALFDFGCGSWVYGQLRAGQVAILIQPAQAKGTAWKVLLGQGPAPTSEYAVASPTQPAAEGWAHLIDNTTGGRALGVGTPDFADRRSEREIRVSAAGEAAIIWKQRPAKRHQVVALYHHVNNPVQISAATSPAAMLHRLQVILPPSPGR